MVIDPIPHAAKGDPFDSGYPRAWLVDRARQQISLYGSFQRRPDIQPCAAGKGTYLDFRQTEKLTVAATASPLPLGAG